MNYDFQSEYFALSSEAIHLLRSGFNYETISNKDINEVSVERGRLVNNWLVILIIGCGLIGFSLFYTIKLYFMLNEGQINRIYIEEIVVPFLPLLMGIYCIYWSLKSGPTLKISLSNNKTKRFPLDKVLKENKIENLISTIRLNPILKNRVKINIAEY